VNLSSNGRGKDCASRPASICRRRSARGTELSCTDSRHSTPFCLGETAFSQSLNEDVQDAWRGGSWSHAGTSSAATAAHTTSPKPSNTMAPGWSAIPLTGRSVLSARPACRTRCWTTITDRLLRQMPRRAAAAGDVRPRHQQAPCLGDQSSGGTGSVGTAESYIASSRAPDAPAPSKCTRPMDRATSSSTAARAAI
jgi:hypothetical protein